MTCFLILFHLLFKNTFLLLGSEIMQHLPYLRPTLVWSPEQFLGEVLDPGGPRISELTQGVHPGLGQHRVLVLRLCQELLRQE